MPNVVFVAPFFKETTLRFLDAVAATPGVRLGLVSQDPAERLSPARRARLAGHYRIDDGLNPAQIAIGCARLRAHLGSLDRILGTLEELQVPLGLVREELGVAGMGSEAARNFRDKSRMKDRLRAAALPCARHRLVSGSEEARAFAAEMGFPLVVKPPSGAGAKSTFRLSSGNDLEEFLTHMPPSPARPTLMEEFIVGQEHSFDSVCVGGRLVWYSINHYYPTPLEVLREPWIQWCVLLPREADDPQYTAIREAAGKALTVLGMDTGLSHMEWFRREDGSVAISEVGARPPGAQFTTLLSYAHDVDFYQAWARLMVEGRFDPPARKYAAGAAFLRAQGHGVVRAVHGIDAAQREVGPIVVEVKLPKPGQHTSGGYEGEGYVLLRHPDTAVVKRGLERIVSLIRVELG